MQQFEFHAYRGDEHGRISATPIITTARCGENAARTRAGRMCKTVNGPVDLALAGSAAWEDRYITTATPSDLHTTGWRFEKLV